MSINDGTCEEFQYFIWSIRSIVILMSEGTL